MIRVHVEDDKIHRMFGIAEHFATALRDLIGQVQPTELEISPTHLTLLQFASVLQRTPVALEECDEDGIHQRTQIAIWEGVKVWINPYLDDAHPAKLLGGSELAEVTVKVKSWE
jgi:hypothetical protein